EGGAARRADRSRAPRVAGAGGLHRQDRADVRLRGDQGCLSGHRRRQGVRADSGSTGLTALPAGLQTHWKRKDLLGIAELDAAEIELVLDTAESFREVAARPIKKVPTLRGRTVLNLFFESSTRTRASFEIAEKRLSADNINFSSSGSSIDKGESLLDTALNLQAMAPDIIVIRHAHVGAPHMLARRLRSSVINAG